MLTSDAPHTRTRLGFNARRARSSIGVRCQTARCRKRVAARERRVHVCDVPHDVSLCHPFALVKSALDRQAKIRRAHWTGKPRSRLCLSPIALKIAK